jgi:hypothetical protein
MLDEWADALERAPPATHAAPPALSFAQPHTQPQPQPQPPWPAGIGASGAFSSGGGGAAAGAAASAWQAAPEVRGAQGGRVAAAVADLAVSNDESNSQVFAAAELAGLPSLRTLIASGSSAAMAASGPAHVAAPFPEVTPE